VSGKGAVLGNCPLLQTRSYFEVTVTELSAEGKFCIGVASERKGKILQHSLKKRKDAYAMECTSETVTVGDVIGVTYDLSGLKAALSFYVNGEELPEQTIFGIKGDVYPCVSLKPGVELTANFGATPFKHDQAHRDFDAIIFSRDLI
jgi:hypothetical protein